MTSARQGLVLVVLLASLWPAPAQAARTEVRDPNDTRGPLDVRRVSKLASVRPMWKIRTWRRWSVERVFDRGYVLVFLDTFGAPQDDYYALVFSDGRRMKGRLFRLRARRADWRVAYLRVWRADRRSVSVRVRLGKTIVGRHRTSYFWRVETLVTGASCRRVCLDRAPQTRRMEEPLDQGAARFPARR
jgi:hypothetical protein